MILGRCQGYPKERACLEFQFPRGRLRRKFQEVPPGEAEAKDNKSIMVI